MGVKNEEMNAFKLKWIWWK